MFSVKQPSTRNYTSSRLNKYQLIFISVTVVDAEQASGGWLAASLYYDDAYDLLTHREYVTRTGDRKYLLIDKSLLPIIIILFSKCLAPANTRYWSNVGLLLVLRLRRSPNNKPALDQCLVFAGAGMREIVIGDVRW